MAAKSKDKDKPSTVYLVDDHPLLVEGLAQLIDAQPDLKVCGSAGTKDEALKDILALRPDIAIVDISLPTGSGIQLIKQAHDQYSDLKVLVLSMHDESFHAERALRAGARGYLMKMEASQNVLVAVRRQRTTGVGSD